MSHVIVAHRKHNVSFTAPGLVAVGAAFLALHLLTRKK